MSAYTQLYITAPSMTAKPWCYGYHDYDSEALLLQWQSRDYCSYIRLEHTQTEHVHNGTHIKRKTYLSKVFARENTANSNVKLYLINSKYLKRKCKIKEIF